MCAVLLTKAVDFVETAMYLEEFKVMVKIHGDDDSTLQIFAKPFQAQVWLGIGLSLIFGGVVMWLLNRSSPCSGYLYQRRGYHIDKNSIVFDDLMFGWSCMLREGRLHKILYAVSPQNVSHSAVYLDP